MTNAEVAVLQLAVFVLSILLGFPIWITLMAMGVFFGYFAYWNPQQMGLDKAETFGQQVEALLNNNIFDLMVNQTYSVMSNDVLTAVPLFLFMGYVVERANIVDRLFATLQIAARHLPASMAVAALATCALFATATGIVGAVVTLMGMLAFPAMLKARYNTSFSAGAICAGGCLGILIPPSIMLIVYGAAASVSVVRLYAGALIPGFMLASLYMIYVITRAMMNPELAPKPKSEDVDGISFAEITWRMLTSFFPLAFLILSVLGAILFGLATPSEAASMGAMGGIVLAICYRIAAMQTGKVTPPWMGTRKEQVNEWLFALGAGGVIALILYIAFFILHIPAATMFGLGPAPRHLPGPPGSGIALALALAVIIKLTGGNLPLLRVLVPTKPFIRPLMAYGGKGALMGLVGGAIYTAIVLSDPKKQFFIFHELNPWGFDVGFFIGLIGWMAWQAVDKDGLQQSVYLSVRTSAMVCWLFVGSWTFSSVFSYLGGHDLIEHWVLAMDLSPIAFLIMAQIIIFLLGWPLEWSEIIIIFVPIFLPMLPHFGIDPLFFGILVALNLQTSFLTPPMAMAAYYLKGVAPPHVQLMDIFRGVMPYLALILLSMVLLYVFPEIALWLPDLAYGK